MAKKSRVNRSEEIHQVFGETPAATAKEVVATLKEKGIVVSEGLVYQVKKNSKVKKGSRAKIAANVPAKVAASSPKVHLSVGASIALIKTTAEKVGGWAALKEIVDALA